MTTATTIEIPQITDYPQVREHDARRAELKRRTSDAAARVGELRAERERLVTALTSGALVAFDARAEAEAHLASIDAQMPQSERELQGLTQALERERQAGAEIRRQAEIDRQRQARQAANELFREMQPLVQQVEAMNRRYMALRAASGNSGCPMPLNPFPFEHWLKQIAGTSR